MKLAPGMAYLREKWASLSIILHIILVLCSIHDSPMKSTFSIHFRIRSSRTTQCSIARIINGPYLPELPLHCLFGGRPNTSTRRRRRSGTASCHFHITNSEVVFSPWKFRSFLWVIPNMSLAGRRHFDKASWGVFYKIGLFHQEKGIKGAQYGARKHME